VTVSLADNTSGASIYYTLNGSTPTTSSAKYSSPLTVSANTTIQAIAVATGYTSSAVGSATYTITAATPSISPAPGSYSTSSVIVTLADATAGASIYYTTNGTTPTTSSAKYSAPLTITSTTTIQALAVASGYANSGVASATYTLGAATPTFSPAAGNYSSSTVTVSLADSTSGASIYYTTNGTTPTSNSTKYSSPLTLSANTTIQAIAVASGYTNSAVASATYGVTAPSPTFSEPGGTYTSAQSVSLSDTVPGAAIYYTTNGATPTTGSTLYSGPISVGASTTVQAIAVASGYNNSAVASATYTINAPGFTLAASTNPLTLQQNAGGTDNISITPVNGFNSPVSLSVSGAPSGVGTAFSGNMLIVFPPFSTPTGTYPLTITGSGGGVTTTLTLPLVITAGATFSLSPASANVSVGRGSSASDSITVTPSNGFSAAVSFAASNVPAGVTATFSPASSASKSTLTFTAGFSAKAGTYTVTIVGTAPAANNSNGFTQSTTITLVIS
jgi:hypothetical protein